MKTNERMRKVLSVLLCLCMVLQYVPTTAFAVTTAEDGLCAHHTAHTAECGYVEAVAGADCTHTHDAACGYVEAVAEVKCACTETDESGALVHTEGCGYVAPVAGSDCTHTHDDACGYVASVSGSACAYHCEICHVQELIDALPNEVTAENAGAVAAQLTAIDSEKASLSEEELAQVNFAKYNAAKEALDSIGQETPEGSKLVDISPAFNGTVTADKSSAEKGETVTLTVTPAEGYELDTLTVTSAEADVSVSVTEVEAGKTYRFIKPDESVTVTATFKALPTCTCTTKCAEGSVNSDCAVCVADLNACGFTDDGESGDAPLEPGDDPLEPVTPSDPNLTTYTVDIAETANGTVTADPTSAAEGETVTLNVTPAAGYQLGRLIVTNVADTSDVTDVTESKTFVMPAADVTVTAVFVACDHEGSTHTTATDNGDGTHSYTCTICNGTGSEDHSADETNGMCICGYQFGFWVERFVDYDDELCGESAWFDTLEDALAYAEGDSGYDSESATVKLYQALTVAEGETVTFGSQVVLNTNGYAVTNNGTIVLGANTTIPAGITGGQVTIGENTYTWDSANSKYVCTDGSHSFGTDNICTVCGAAAVAKIGDTYYTTLSDAAAKVTEGGTIEILTDVTIAEDETVTFAAYATLAVAEGKTVTCNGTVKIGESDGIIFENKLYYYGGDITNYYLDLSETTPSTYYKAGEGYAIYNGSDTLTLHNATITGFENNSGSRGIGADVDLTILFSGTNSVTAPAFPRNSVVIWGDGALTLTGKDTGSVLNIAAVGGTFEDRGIVCDSLTVNGGTVNISGSGSEIGIEAHGNVTVQDGAVLNVTCGNGIPALGTVSAESGGVINAIVLSYAVDGENAMFNHTVMGDAVLSADLTPMVMEGMTTTFAVPAGTSLTVNSGVTLDLSGLAVDNIDFSGNVINNGTIKLPAAYTYETIPDELNGTVMIGDKSYTYDSENSEWICGNDAAHTGGTQTCKGYQCEICGAWYGDVDADAHTYDETTHKCTLCGAMEKFQVLYDEGDGLIVGYPVAYGTALTEAEKNYSGITKTGYTLEGYEWYTDAALTQKYTGTTMPAQNLYLKILWKVNTYTITWTVVRETWESFAPSATRTELDSFTTETVYGSTITEPDYELPEGHELRYMEMDYKTMPAQDVTGTLVLYYVESPVHIWVDAYNSEMNLIYNNDVISAVRNHLSRNNVSVEKTGYTHDGWKIYLDNKQTQEYTGTTMPAQAVYVYAVFTPNEYTVTWDVDGKTSTTQQTYDAALTLPTEPTKTGCKFLGWYTAADGGEEVTAETVYKTVGETTYYARFCDHSGNTNTTITDNGDGITHSKICSVCGGSIIESHFVSGYSADGAVITNFCIHCNAKTGTATISAKDATYTGMAYDAANNITVTGTGTLENHSWSYTYSGTANDGSEYLYPNEAPTSAGNYQVSITVGEGDDAVTATASFTINKADPDIGEVSYEGILYNSTDPANITLSHTAGSDGTLKLTDKELKVGTGTYHWKYTPTGYNAYNYNEITGTVTLTVQEDTIQSITTGGTLDKSEYTYGEAFSLDGLTVTATYASGDTKDVTELVSFDNTLAAGQTSVELTYQGKTCKVTGITVAKKQLVISGMSWDVPEDAVYNNTAYTATLIGDLPEGVTVTKTGNTGTNAGSYTATAKFSLADGYSADNYEIVNGEARTADWSIARKDISEAEITLGTALTYNGSVQTQTVTNVEIDGLTVTYTLSGNTGTDAEDYTLTVTGTGNFEGTATKTWSIAKKNITGATITLGTVLTYNGVEQTMKVTDVKIDGLTVTYGVSGNEQTNAGSYTLTVTGNGNFAGTASAGWSIGKAALTVTAKDHTITYGDEPAANGVSYDGFVSSEIETVLGGELSYSYNYEQYGNIGTYTITPSGLTSDNYEITFKTGALTVEAKEITVTANAVSKTYGDADPELTYKVEGLVNGDKLSGALTREAGTDVGTYAITQGTLTAGSNYTINYTGATLTINQKAITEADVKLKDSLTYTGRELTQEVTVTEGITYDISGNKETNVGTYELTVTGTGNYTGEVKLSWTIKEAVAVVGTAPTAKDLTYTGKDQALVNAGITADGTMVYSLTEDGGYTESIPTGNAAGSYTVWYKVIGDSNHSDSEPASVSVTIKKAAAAYNAPSANTLTYNGSAQALVTEGTTAGGTMMYKLGEDGTYSETIPTAENAGTYTVYCYVKGDSNHNNSAAQKIEVTIGQLDITGKTVDITLAVSLTYNGAEQTMGVSSVKLDDLTVTHTVSGNKGTNADSYILTVTGTGNFKGTATKEWSIARKSVTVTAKDQTITYGETISGTKVSAAGLVDGHSVTATLTPSTANVTVNGTITASAAVITADGTDVTANYDISYTSGKLVIEPDTSKIDALTTDNVTSANEEDIKAVQAMMASAETDGIDEATAAQWAAITATCEDLIEKIEAVEAENDRIADVAADFDLNTVKSSDEAAITALISDIDEQLATNNLTDEERSELEGLKTKCNNLIAKIDGTETLIGQLDKTVDDLDAETVKSTDKAALEQVIADAQTLINSGNVTEAEKEALKQTQEDAKALIKVIDDTAAENKALTDQAATFDEDTVKSTDKAELEQLAQDIEDLLDTQNLTEDERTALEAVLEQVEGMIDTINETVEDSKTATDTIGALDSESVTSDDQEKIEQAIATIDALLKDDHLTEDERKALEDAKTDAEALIDVIEAAQDATDTENTEKVEDVTAENVKPEDKEALEDAKADLEKALEDNAGNYTEEEKKAIEDEIQRIEDAIEALENVEDVTETITQLPETVEPDDEETAEKILDAKKAYDELTDHEKSLVDETTKEKLDGLVAALTDYKIIKGNGGKWTKGSSSGLSFTANGPFSKFVGIEVDGEEVASTYYTAEAGSTVITLKQSFLKRLSTGEHTITVLYTDGEASGTFKILAQSTSPATGDDSNLMLWSGLLCVSTLGLVVLLADHKRRRSTK